MNLGAVVARLRAFEAGRKQAIAMGINDGLNYAYRDAISKYMEGGARDINVDPPNPAPGPLKIRTGTLRRAVFKVGPIISGDDKITAGLGVRDVPYGRIHEYGGTTKPHIIVPVRAKRLRFFDRGGNLQFRTMVRHPGSVIPARPYLRPALEDNVPKIGALVRDRLINLWRNG